MGAAALSLPDGRSLHVFRDLFQGVGVCIAGAEQHLLGVDLHSDFFDCATNLFREGRGLVGMGVGSAAERDVLEHARGVGDQSVGAVAGDVFWLSLVMEELDGWKPWLRSGCSGASSR